MSLPLLDLTRQFTSDYQVRFDMIKTSRCFQICRTNTIVGCLTLLLDLIWLSFNIAMCYEASMKYIDISAYCIGSVTGALVCISLNLAFYYNFDDEDYRNRTIAAEVLTYETIEMMESILRNEEVENVQEISVLTDKLTSKQELNITDYCI